MPKLTSVLVLFALTMLNACGKPVETPVDRAVQELPRLQHQGDLDVIREHGVLRLLLERQTDSYLPRFGDALFSERQLAQRFGERLGLKVEIVYVDRFTDLIPALIAGRGDLVAANLSVTPERQSKVEFTDPIGSSQDTLVFAAVTQPPTDNAALVGSVAAREGTTLLQSAYQLAEQHPALQVVSVSPDVANEALFDQLVDGEVDLLVQDGNVLATALAYRSDIRAGPVVGEPLPLAWAVRPDAKLLLAALNDYLREYRLLGEAHLRYVADVDEIRDRGRLRMITRNNAATYFLWRGQLLGFEYELAERFADELGVTLDVIVAPSHEQLLPMLKAGEGDFVAAYLVPTEDRKTQAAFSRPYHFASEVVVGRKAETPMTSVDDLNGRTVVVRRSSAYWETLKALQDRNDLDFKIVLAPSDMETQELIQAVAEGRYDLTVADSHILNIEMTWRDDITGLINLTDKHPHAWAVHPESTELLEVMNGYLTSAYRGLHYNLSYAKYFQDAHFKPEEDTELFSPGRISPYDALVRKYAEEHGFDWRLIVAQMYQESRFDPNAQSWMGAVGLMQVLPRTAKQYGFTDLADPEASVEVGLIHMNWVRDRFPNHLAADDRIWFVLAAYNAGHGHVQDARRLAKRLGLDPDQWFDNVERAMLKLSEPEYARQARHGYVRGHEPVKYVRSIRQRYLAYANLLAN
ncbi:MAG: transporter substrate-binding domain-containing protein [Pseudomonadota bacterium]|nr:transporter substrate-binding domain-containing protein [Pseudomonadota bacterium]